MLIGAGLPGSQDSCIYAKFSFQQKLVISCEKNSPAVKKGKAKNAQEHAHQVTTTKRHDIKIWPRSIDVYSIGTFVHSFSVCFTLSHPVSCTIMCA